MSEEPERRMAWLRAGTPGETRGSFQRARVRDGAGAFSSPRPPLLNITPPAWPLQHRALPTHLGVHPEAALPTHTLT